MMQPLRFSNYLRQQVIALYQQGKDYGTIGHELGLTQDTIRNWIYTYRLANHMHTGTYFLQREERYADARKEYENTSASLMAIARKHKLNYNNLRNYLKHYHPESSLLHTYAKQSSKAQNVTDLQMGRIDANLPED